MATSLSPGGILAGAGSGRGTGECLDVGDRWFLDHQMRQMIRYNIILRQPFSDEPPHLLVSSASERKKTPRWQASGAFLVVSRMSGDDQTAIITVKTENPEQKHFMHRHETSKSIAMTQA
ncbi:hypothetical protein QD172_14070 [Cobetia sp. 10Alg 146]|uniref:hypothetical protein n=1 Tax=Cobetia sp. 10Alg 146 TaxID=3040019 RepID=UPI002446D6D3|nr:hypothetical protein [Cobetia sp. 10Alg 146]MDH2292368.1 hypothetical protein [Cobetia sp. 10Alg 146]